MKIGSDYLKKFNGLEAWLDKSTQKENFLKILSNCDNKSESEVSVVDSDIAKINGDNNTISEKLVGAAEGYIGTPYKEIDCYELVVNSLEKSGINYRGQNGMAAYLANTAKAQNLPVNTYMTGEGIVAAAGSHVFSKTINSVDEPASLAKKILGDMGSTLEKGAILSFSMQTRGHTGIISKADNLWTFVNSGRMDHNIRDGKLKKAVGEEPLEAEIVNWLKLADKKKEALTITLGKFEDHKLASFLTENKRVSFKV